ncbi:hypothetical protein PVW47_08495, partial [Marinovum sp. SP66]|uniref:hypothetical protein n=1 Tax=Marinovum sp. SP66 TaxID=3028379 RepID=UPI00237A1B2F
HSSVLRAVNHAVRPKSMHPEPSPVENHIPTMPGDGRGNQGEQMVPKELITETLLPEPTPPNVPV